MEDNQGAGGKARSRELAAEVVQDLHRLVDLEILLAKQEVKELAITNGIAAACLAAAGLLAAIGLLVAIPVLVVEAVPWHWEAALAWVVAYLVVAGGLAVFGRRRLQLKFPTRTLDSLKENKEWALRRLRSTSR
ncbi:MAG TPA: phage holin family protein [Candidatus Dormibacteraeota bacterium]|jgi:predicted lysophospholipase L1 biosynthesis ABC-type transport system permease subunit